jgi:hypothetical protein
MNLYMVQPSPAVLSRIQAEQGQFGRRLTALRRSPSSAAGQILARVAAAQELNYSYFTSARNQAGKLPPPPSAPGNGPIPLAPVFMRLQAGGAAVQQSLSQLQPAESRVAAGAQLSAGSAQRQAHTVGILAALLAVLAGTGFG